MYTILCILMKKTDDYANKIMYNNGKIAGFVSQNNTRKPEDNT